MALIPLNLVPTSWQNQSLNIVFHKQVPLIDIVFPKKVASVKRGFGVLLGPGFIFAASPIKTSQIYLIYGVIACLYTQFLPIIFHNCDYGCYCGSFKWLRRGMNVTCYSNRCIVFFMKQNYFNISTECSYFQNRPD